MSGILEADIPYSLTPAEKKTVDAFCRPEAVAFSGRFMSPPKRAGKPNQELIFVMGSYRVLFVYAGGKVANEAHLYDLIEINTSVPREVTLNFRTFSQTLLSTSKVADIVAQVQKFYITYFPGMAVSFLANSGDSIINTGPCGGFTQTYRCLSDLLSAPVREDIVHDIDIFYSASNIKELNLNDWPEPPTILQSRALISSLKYNDWFTSVIARGPAVKVGNEGIVALTDVLQTNKKIQAIELVSVGSHEAWITNEIWMTFALNNYLTSVSLSSNPIEDKGCFSICTHWLSTVSHPILSLNLEKCDIGTKGTQLLFRTLRENKWVSKNIKSLSVSYNKIEDSASELVLFLREASSLQQLEINHTNPTWSTLKNTVVQSEKRLSNTPTPKSLTRLGLAGNKIPKSEIFSDIAAFLQNIAPALTDLDLSATSLPLVPHPTRALFAAIPNLVNLELADNEFGEDGLHTLVEILTGTDPQPLLKLKVLNLSRNITYNPQSRQKLKGHGIKALEKLVSLQSNLLCPIDTLKFAASTNTRLKTEIVPLVNALSTNETITCLDLTGHIAGDELAVALGRMLQVNHTLKSLSIDENLVSVMGLEFIALGLKRNFSLTHFPIPIQDISEQLKLAENREGIQQLRERLRIATIEETHKSLVTRAHQVVGDLQTITSNNSVRSFHEALRNKAAARREKSSKPGAQE